MASIFLSYAQSDRPRVMPLARALEDLGWIVWWDRKIPVGGTWDEIIEKQLDAAGAVIAVWTEAGVRSRWVRTEAAEGLSRGVLVPVLLDDVKVPLAFRQIQAADLRDWEPGVEHVGLQNLVDALEVKLRAAQPSEPEPTPTSVMAEREPPAESVAVGEPAPVVDPAEQALTRSRELAANGDWEEVITVLTALEDEVSGLPEANPDVVELLNEARRRLEAADLYEEAEVLYTEGQFEDAVRRLQRVEDLDPDFELAGELSAKALRHIEQRRQDAFDHEYSRARESLEAREWLVAVARLERLLADAPDHPDVQADLERARAGVRASRRYDELREMLQDQQWDEVLVGLTALADEQPGFGDPENLRQQAVTGRRMAAAKPSDLDAAATSGGSVPTRSKDGTREGGEPVPDRPDVSDAAASDLVATTTDKAQEATDPGSATATDVAGAPGGEESSSRGAGVVPLVGLVAIAAIIVVAVVVALITSGDGDDDSATLDTEAAVEEEPAEDAASDGEESEESEGEAASHEAGSEGAIPQRSDDADLWLWLEEGQAEALQPTIDRFTEETGVIIQISELADSFQILDAVPVAAPSGEGPDIFAGFHNQTGQFVEEGVIGPLDLEQSARDYNPIAVRGVTVDGTVYGLPYATENVALIRNTDLVRTAPASWAELEEVALSLQADGTVEVPLAIVGDPYHYNPIYTSFGGYVFGDEAGSYDTSDVGLDSDGGLDAARSFAGYFESGLISAEMDYDAGVTSFSSGRAPFAITGPWAISTFEDAGVSYAIDPIPSAGGMPSAPFVGVRTFFVSAFSENTAVAATFLLDFVNSSEAMLSLHEAQSGTRTPAHLPTYEAVQDDPIVAGFGAAGEEGEPIPNIPEMLVVWAPWTDAYIAVSQGTDPGQAFSEAADEIRAAV